MKYSRLSVVCVCLAVLVILFAYGHASKSGAQDTEKSLDIERYPNEPLELVDLRIGQNSVKNDIKSKSRDSSRQWEDTVKFRDKENWLRNLQLRLRNTSGRAIYSLTVSIHLISSGSHTGFLLPLRKIELRNFKQQPLKAGEEIDLGVTESAFNDTMATIRQYGRDANQMQPILHVDEALFSDDLMWRQGVLMRRDPSNPTRWKAIDNAAASSSQPIETGWLLTYWLQTRLSHSGKPH